MYIIHRTLKRTQLYLDEEEFRMLEAEGRRRGTTVSALVRDAIREAYGTSKRKNRRHVIERLSGVWADHGKMAGAEEFVRGERRSERPQRWTGERGAVSSRH